MLVSAEQLKQIRDEFIRQVGPVPIVHASVAAAYSCDGLVLAWNPAMYDKLVT